jgi:hypothetical protein
MVRDMQRTDTAQQGDSFTSPVYLVAYREAEKLISRGHIISEIHRLLGQNLWGFKILL